MELPRFDENTQTFWARMIRTRTARIAIAGAAALTLDGTAGCGYHVVTVPTVDTNFPTSFAPSSAAPTCYPEWNCDASSTTSDTTQEPATTAAAPTSAAATTTQAPRTTAAPTTKAPADSRPDVVYATVDASRAVADCVTGPENGEPAPAVANGPNCQNAVKDGDRTVLIHGVVAVLCRKFGETYPGTNDNIWLTYKLEHPVAGSPGPYYDIPDALVRSDYHRSGLNVGPMQPCSPAQNFDGARLVDH